MRNANRQRLLNATQAVGVTLGRYDREVLGWLAGWEPETVEAIAAVIERAGARDA